jgi:CBS domain-containing protein
MTQNPSVEPLPCLFEDDLIDVAQRLMRSAKAHALPVCTPDGQATGVLTEAEIEDAPEQPGPRVREVMSPPPVICHAEDPLAHVEALMRERHAAYALCVDEFGSLLGLLGPDELGQIGNHGHVGRVLRGVTRR